MFPNTSAATAALSVARRFYSPALLNHCLRSYLWGTMSAAAHDIAYDDELYYVTALLHDMGLTPAFDSHQLPFEEAGGELGWVFGTAAGWPADRAARANEIIVLHMRDDVPAGHRSRITPSSGRDELGRGRAPSKTRPSANRTEPRRHPWPTPGPAGSRPIRSTARARPPDDVPLTSATNGTQAGLTASRSGYSRRTFVH